MQYQFNHIQKFKRSPLCIENLMSTIYQAESGVKKKIDHTCYYFTCTYDHQQKHINVILSFSKIRNIPKSIICHWQHNVKHEDFNLWSISSADDAMLLTKQTNLLQNKSLTKRILLPPIYITRVASRREALTLLDFSTYMLLPWAHSVTQLINIIPLLWQREFRKHSSPHLQ